jgi:uncharacterized protein (TIGR03067 family)
MKLLLALLLQFALAIAAFAGPTHDSQDIQGTWLPVKAELGGKTMGNDFLTNTILQLDAGKYDVTVAGAHDKGVYILDAGLKPKTLDITGAEGPNAGRKIPCIYELDGNTLKICYGLGNSPRPSEFKSPSGTRYFLVTYKRKKL